MDEQKENHPLSQRPHNWKLFSGVLSEKIYDHLEAEQLFPEEQKGCRKGSRGTKEHLLVDKMVMRNCKRRKTNLVMAWIDNKKAYDMVPHSWILETLQLTGVAQNIQQLVGASMKNWRTTLMSNGQNLVDVNIRRGIFQGDNLSPLLFVVCLIPLSVILRKTKGKYQLGKEGESINHLLFMGDLKLYGNDERQIDSLINTVRVFSDGIRMEFGLKKCAVVVMKRGKVVKNDGVDLPDRGRMKSIEEDGYKYLGILEYNEVLHAEMKIRLQNEYYRRLKRILYQSYDMGPV